MSDTNTEAFPEGAPQPLSPKGKKVLFGLGAAAATGLFCLIVFSGGSAKARETPAAAPGQGRLAASDTQDYERQMPAQLPDAIVPKEDPTNNPLRNALERRPPPELQVPDEESRSSKGFQPATYIPAGSGAGGAPAQYRLSADMQRRMSEDYQRMVKHFQDRGPKKWAMSEDAFGKMGSAGDPLANVSRPLRQLVEGSGALISGTALTVPSGTRLIAVTDSKVSSDHPGFFTATLVRPYALKGAKLICQSGANQKDRIPIQPVKLILADSAEVALTGQVQTDFPGFDGDVSTHYMARLGPAITNAAIGGAFAAWAFNRNASGPNIDTRDAIVAPVVQSSVEGLQNEITRLGGDYPNTVEVPAGKQFTVLITEPFSVKR